jgi:hypothetical protein
MYVQSMYMKCITNLILDLAQKHQQALKSKIKQDKPWWRQWFGIWKERLCKLIT